jgi:hypothetical protein
MVSGNTWCVMVVGMRLRSFAHSTSIPTTGKRENTYTTFPYDLRPDNKKHNCYSCPMWRAVAWTELPTSILCAGSEWVELHCRVWLKDTLLGQSTLPVPATSWMYHMAFIQANNKYLGDSSPFICDAVLLGEHQQFKGNVNDHPFSDTCHIIQDLNPQQTPMRTPTVTNLP